MKFILAGLIPVLLAGCSLFRSPDPDPITLVSRLEPGMSKETVRRMLGEPAKAEFNTRADAWHYCRSGKSAAEFAVVMFYDGKITSARQYTAPGADSQDGCARHIKPALYPPAR